MTPKPERPDWAVYGPWWDEKSENWLVICENHWAHYWTDGDWYGSCDRSRAHTELVRLAQENERLRAGLQLTIEEYDELVHSEYDGTSFLNPMLNQINEARRALEQAP